MSYNNEFYNERKAAWAARGYTETVCPLFQRTLNDCDAAAAFCYGPHHPLCPRNQPALRYDAALDSAPTDTVSPYITYGKYVEQPWA